jgi:hypothetical protein
MSSPKKDAASASALRDERADKVARKAAKAAARAAVEAESDEAAAPKAKSMRTAEAVIDRIRHDPALQSADFIVAYLDRFKGIQEVPYDLFFQPFHPDFCDVPQHRIKCTLHSTPTHTRNAAIASPCTEPLCCWRLSCVMCCAVLC